MNLRSKLLIASSAIVLILISSSVLSFIGYRYIINSIGNIHQNREREDAVRTIQKLVFEESRIASDAVIGMDASKKERFLEISRSVTDTIAKLRKEEHLLKSEDVKELIYLEEQQKRVEGLFNSVQGNIEYGKKQELVRLVKESGKALKNILDREQVLKDSVNARLGYSVNQAFKEIKQLESLTNDQLSEIKKFSGVISRLQEEMNRVNGWAGEPSGGIKSEDFKTLLKSIQSNLNLQTSTTDSIAARGANSRLQIASIDMEGIERDLMLLTNVNRLIYWTQKKYYAQTEAAIFMDDSYKNFNEAAAGVNEYLAALMPLALGQEGLILESITSANSEFDKSASDLLAGIKKVRNEELQSYYKDFSNERNKSLEGAERLEHSFKGYLADNIRESQDLQLRIILIMAAVVLVSLLLGILMAVMLYRVIRPIKGMIQLLNKVETGDLSLRTDVCGKDEIGELGTSVNRLLEGQQKIVGQVVTASKEISLLKQRLSEVFSFSRENSLKMKGSIKSFIENIRVGVPAAGSGLENASRLATGVKGVSDAAGKVVDGGMKVMKVAETGEQSVVEAQQVIGSVNHTVRKLADIIGRLEESSGEIGAITDTITDIASRTNLLALNAAIEAARSGQQGKGFAVLADEIRKLSDGSNKAAGEIKHLISEIQHQIQDAVDNMNAGVGGVEDGVLKISKVRESISEIIHSVRFVVDSVRSTAEAAVKEEESTEELIKVMGLMNETVANTSASGETLERSLQEQTRIINDMEALYKVLDEASENLEGILKTDRQA